MLLGVCQDTRRQIFFESADYQCKNTHRPRTAQPNQSQTLSIDASRRDEPNGAIGDHVRPGFNRPAVGNRNPENPENPENLKIDQAAPTRTGDNEMGNETHHSIPLVKTSPTVP